MLCDDVQKLIHPYVDGEFGDDERVSFERHLTACPSCRDVAAFQSAFKSALRAKVRTPPAPADLKHRIRLALAQAPTPVVGWQRTALKVAPVAAAAMCLLLLGVSLHRRDHTDSLVASSVARHTHELPVEIASPDADSVRSWFRGKVAFPVRAPRFAGMPAAQLVGGRMSNLEDQDAAYLVYHLGGAKVSVFLFDPSEVQISGPSVEIAGREVFLDQQRGYHVALFQRDGVGYAITSDVDEVTMLQLVSAFLGE